MVGERIARLEAEVKYMRRSLDELSGLMRETRDLLFEMRGKKNNGGHIVGAFKDIIMALIGAILGILGIKVSGG